MNQNYLISIVGPTAIGKTSLSIALAKHFSTEIISADSRQFYKELSIGTAVPNAKELIQVKHHFIHHKSIEEDYNVGAFERDGIALLDELFLKHSVLIMVGGSGLYVDAITKGLDDFPNIDESIRESLNLQYKTDGLEKLQNQLKALDLETYESIDLQNPHRVIRALEVCLGTGKKFSSFLKNKESERNFSSILVGLTAERSTIYDRINKRVEMMVEEGLVEEARSVYNQKHLNALNTVGYKEMFKYFDGEWLLDFAIAEIKKNSRRYAKRQLTWFRKNEEIMWFDYETPLSEIIDSIETTIQNHEA